MKVESYSNSGAFFERHAARWLENEAEEGVFLRYQKGVEDRSVIRVAVLGDDGAVLLTACAVPEDQIVLSRADVGALSCLVSYLCERGVQVRGIFAPHPTSLRFAEATTVATGVHFEVVKSLLHYELSELEPISASAGGFRQAEARDEAILIDFSRASQAEGNTQRPFDSAKAVARDLRTGSLYVWETQADGIVGAGGVYLARSPRSGHVDGVYTRPDQRSRGFATALVGRLSRIILDAGLIPALSVDAANAAAIKVYEKLGYVARCQMDNLRRV